MASINRHRQSSELYQHIWRVIDRIPEGRIATYGQIARLAGLGFNARLVGYALHALPEGSDIPWHRVVNAKGRISLRSEGGYHLLQKKMLENENVRFVNEVIDLEIYGWRPESYSILVP